MKEFAPHGSKFFPFRVDPCTEGTWCAGKQKIKYLRYVGNATDSMYCLPEAPKGEMMMNTQWEIKCQLQNHWSMTKEELQQRNSLGRASWKEVTKVVTHLSKWQKFYDLNRPLNLGWCAGWLGATLLAHERLNTDGVFVLIGIDLKSWLSKLKIRMSPYK